MVEEMTAADRGGGLSLGLPGLAEDRLRSERAGEGFRHQWENGLPSVEELVPLNQTLISPVLACAFSIKEGASSASGACSGMGHRTDAEAEKAAQATLQSLLQAAQIPSNFPGNGINDNAGGRGDEGASGGGIRRGGMAGGLGGAGENLQGIHPLHSFPSSAVGDAGGFPGGKGMNFFGGQNGFQGASQPDKWVQMGRGSMPSFGAGYMHPAHSAAAQGLPHATGQQGQPPLMNHMLHSTPPSPKDGGVGGGGEVGEGTCMRSIQNGDFFRQHEDFRAGQITFPGQARPKDVDSSLNAQTRYLSEAPGLVRQQSRVSEDPAGLDLWRGEGSRRVGERDEGAAWMESNRAQQMRLAGEESKDKGGVDKASGRTWPGEDGRSNGRIGHARLEMVQESVRQSEDEKEGEDGEEMVGSVGGGSDSSPVEEYTRKRAKHRGDERRRDWGNKSIGVEDRKGKGIVEGGKLVADKGLGVNGGKGEGEERVARELRREKCEDDHPEQDSDSVGNGEGEKGSGGEEAGSEGGDEDVGEDGSPPAKKGRKLKEGEDGDEPCDDSTGNPDMNSSDDQQPRTLKRPRLVWTPQLHKRFVDAVGHLGIKNAVPKTIMQLMNVEGLTRENVASHLQKYRLYLKRMQGLSPEGPSPSDALFASNPLPSNLTSPPHPLYMNPSASMREDILSHAPLTSPYLPPPPTSHALQHPLPSMELLGRLPPMNEALSYGRGMNPYAAYSIPPHHSFAPAMPRPFPPSSPPPDATWDFLSESQRNLNATPPSPPPRVLSLFPSGGS